MREQQGVLDPDKVDIKGGQAVSDVFDSPTSVLAELTATGILSLVGRGDGDEAYITCSECGERIELDENRNGVCGCRETPERWVAEPLGGLDDPDVNGG